MPWFRPRARAKSRPIDAELWRGATSKWLFMRGLGTEENARLKELAERFLGGKHFSGTHELEVTPQMEVVIAAQACILVLELGAEWYDGWSEIIVYPDEFVAEYEFVDEHGIAHHVEEPMTGESWLAGPVILSWADAQQRGGETGYNVVIHEFAHKLDMLNGDANGFPPLHAGMDRVAWTGAFNTAYEDFRRRVERDEPTGLDPYAAENPAEFFAVLSEAFFEVPGAVRAAYGEVYRQLTAFYRQDPAERLARRAAPAAVQ